MCVRWRRAWEWTTGKLNISQLASMATQTSTTRETCEANAQYDWGDVYRSRTNKPFDTTHTKQKHTQYAPRGFPFHERGGVGGSRGVVLFIVSIMRCRVFL
jgi:hypothetical protein